MRRGCTLAGVARLWLWRASELLMTLFIGLAMWTVVFSYLILSLFPLSLSLSPPTEWLKSLFWKEEMELTLIGLQNSGKTTFVNVIGVRRGSMLQTVVLWLKRNMFSFF